MKAFVVKNKEGKYLYEYGYCNFGDNISYVHVEEDRKELENLLENYKLVLGDCEVVEITIAEGDLEQENKQLKERIQNILEGKEIPAICAKKYEEYEEQLAEKDKEINKLQQMAIIDMQTKEILELQVATIRKQVCDEIREKLPYYEYSFQEPEVPRVDVIEIRDIEFILDQIEQAKESMK